MFFPDKYSCSKYIKENFLTSVFIWKIQNKDVLSVREMCYFYSIPLLQIHPLSWERQERLYIVKYGFKEKVSVLMLTSAYLSTKKENHWQTYHDVQLCEIYFWKSFYPQINALLCFSPTLSFNALNGAKFEFYVMKSKTFNNLEYTRKTAGYTMTYSSETGQRLLHVCEEITSVLLLLSKKTKCQRFLPDADN